MAINTNSNITLDTSGETPMVTGPAGYYISNISKNLGKAVGSIDMVPGNGSCSYDSSSSTNVTVSDTNTSGVKVVFTGSGSVSAVAKITTAGYTPTNTSFATGTSTSSNSIPATKYITGVTLTNETEFDITVPNGSSDETVTFHFVVDGNGNTTITS
jgi:hypothetical protein